MRKGVLPLLALAVVVILLCPQVLAAAPGSPTFYKMVGTNEGRFNYIGKCALDVQGNLYITDQGNHRIQKFDPQGNFLRFFGGYGTDPGQFNYPWGVKVDPQGFIYVSDLMNSRIQKLHPDGSVAMIISNVAARNLEVDAQGNIYTVDGFFSLLKYDAAGNLIWKVGHAYDPNQPNDPLYMAGPLGLALGPGGIIYVADQGHGSVKLFDANGNLLSSHFIIDDQLWDIALDSQGYIYIAETNSFRVGVFDANFTRLYNIPGVYYTVSITVDAESNVYLTNMLDQMIKTTATGTKLMTLGRNGSAADDFSKPGNLAKDPYGNVYLNDPLFRDEPTTYGSSWMLGNHRIRKFDSNGNLILTFGKNGNGPGEFFLPGTVAADSAGNIFVGGNRYDQVSWIGSGFVQKFDAGGQFISDFLAFDGANTLVRSLTIDNHDILYIPYLGTPQPNILINKFTATGTKLSTIITSDPTLYPVPRDLAIDSQGNAFLCLENYIGKFDPDGNLLFLRTGQEGSAGQMRSFGLDVDAAGNVWVADTYHHRIMCFDNDGNFLFSFGHQGFGPGEFQLPQDVVVANNLLFVSDTYNQRVQIFEVAQAPKADAGENITITSEHLSSTILLGKASGTGNNALSYRWLEGTNVLLDWQLVGNAGEANLNLDNVNLPMGTHTLTLEVSNGVAKASDDMILTIDNSAPHAVPGGAGTYELGTSVTLRGEVSDFDGDQLSYTWKESSNLLTSGTVATIYAGTPVKLPDFQVAGLSLGRHTLTLEATDGVNTPAIQTMEVNIIDTQAPVLAPSVNQSILWPPDHRLVGIVINANASDNSGLPVTLSAVVTSSEPEDGLGDGDLSPDWTKPVISQDGISLQLRAERSGKGGGRTYLVKITATDSSGNSSQADVRIIVPHDRGKI